MLQRIVLYAVLGFTLDAAEINISHWAFWCILALFLASEWMTRRETVERIELELRSEIERIRRAKEQDHE